MAVGCHDDIDPVKGRGKEDQAGNKTAFERTALHDKSHGHQAEPGEQGEIRRRKGTGQQKAGQGTDTGCSIWHQAAHAICLSRFQA